ncbi:MAG: ATP-binding protein [Myxococcaceae bacterium]|nr:ATP-binding protein [Myxococcaceae bacterium]
MASLWHRLTEPSALVLDGLERRQAKILASALVLILPVWALTVAASLATRTRDSSTLEWVLIFVINALAIGSYALSRTRFHRAGASILILTSIIGANIAQLSEPDRLRVVVGMLYAALGPIYSAILINTRATLLAAVGTMACFVGFGLLNPVLTTTDFVLPLFLLGFLLSLTVVASAVRESQLKVIQAQSAHLAATIESAIDAVVAVDRGGKVTSWSRRAEAVFERTAAEAVGQPLARVVASGPEADRLEESLGQQHPTRLEFERPVGPDGRRAFEASMAPLKDGSGAVVVLRDVTERKQIEARLMMTDRLETMGRLVAGVAHEINNPLAYVQANLRALEEDLATPALPARERHELLAETLDGTKRIQTIVKDLLTFSRHSGEYDALTAVNVEATMESALHIAQVHVTNAKASIIRQYGNVGTIMGIESRLGQVFLTLIMNAVQALPATGGRRELLVSTRLEGGKVIVAVRDFGEGMTPEVRARLFTPFFTTKPVGKGTGLGLSIAHSIVISLGGEIRVESAKGQGALFEVVLPSTPPVG